ncbi:TonB family protein [Variovorax sp. VNK109]|uniref:TonB family protein n=1 Tax=Variovorax sp. VNK109 TaxID=3400919 RepID=UPI003C01613F
MHKPLPVCASHSLALRAATGLAVLLLVLPAIAANSAVAPIDRQQEISPVSSSEACSSTQITRFDRASDLRKLARNCSDQAGTMRVLRHLNGREPPKATSITLQPASDLLHSVRSSYDMDVFFNSFEAYPPDEAFEKLDALFTKLASTYRIEKLSMVGSADVFEKNARAGDLASQRIDFLRRYLAGAGISPDHVSQRIEVVNSADTTDGRAQDRSVRIKIRALKFRDPAVASGAPPTPPVYPLLSKRLGEEGLVLVSVVLDMYGLPKETTLKRSSGFPRLDEAAVDAVSGWYFTPGMQNGYPVSGSIDVPVRFVLQSSLPQQGSDSQRMQVQDLKARAATLPPSEGKTELAKLIAEIEKRLSGEKFDAAVKDQTAMSPTITAYRAKALRRIEDCGTRYWPVHNSVRLYGSGRIRFAINRAGLLLGTEIVSSSGDIRLDRHIQAAVTATAPFGPLPAEPANDPPVDSLVLEVRFNFKRDADDLPDLPEGERCRWSGQR